MPIESEEGVRSTAGVLGSFELSDVALGTDLRSSARAV